MAQFYISSMSQLTVTNLKLLSYFGEDPLDKPEGSALGASKAVMKS